MTYGMSQCDSRKALELQAVPTLLLLSSVC